MLTLDDLVTDDVLDAAYAWLCRRRRAFPDTADVWAFRRAWPAERARLVAELRAGTYRVGLLARLTIRSGEEVDVWPARDVLVMKCCAMVLGRRLPISPRCLHLKGRGGSKGAVRAGRAGAAWAVRAAVRGLGARGARRWGARTAAGREGPTARGGWRGRWRGP